MLASICRDLHLFVDAGRCGPSVVRLIRCEKLIHAKGGEQAMSTLQIRNGLESAYSDVYTPEALTALAALARFNAEQKMLLLARSSPRDALSG